MKILIAYDGSQCADAAMIDLLRAGLPGEAEAVALSAVDVFLPPKSDESEEPFPLYVPHGVKLAHERAEHAFADAEALAAKAAERLGEMFPGWTVTPEARADVPHWAIIFKAEEWKPDLVVVGSHGRTALGRAFLGSVSQKVLYESPVSVRVARRTEISEGSPIRLVLGADGSPDSEAMIEEVAARDWQEGTEAKIVTAVETFQQYDADTDSQMNHVRDLQALAAAKLEKAGLKAETIVTLEDPKSFLTRLAEDWNADCIFLGAKGHRFLERVFLGSVSSAVAARAHCSVEVVRRKS